MKLTLHLLKRLAIYFIIFLLPSALVIVSYKLYSMGISIYNLGINSIFYLFISNLLTIILTSYILAVIFSVALIDKVKVSSLIILHLIPIFITIGIMSIFYFTTQKGRFFLINSSSIKIGYKTFFKRGRFNEVKDKIIYIGSPHLNTKESTSFIYDRINNKIVPISRIKIRNGEIYFYKNDNKPTYRITYKDATRNPSIYSSKLLVKYTNTMQNVIEKIKETYKLLKGLHKYYYMISMVVSFLILIIPLAFIMNDGAWGTSGITGIMIIICFIPYFYHLLFKYGRYLHITFFRKLHLEYLIFPIMITVIGVIFNLVIKISRKAEI